MIGYNITEFDPTTHVDSWRSAWRTLTKKAGLPGFRFHDLRHCAITSLAESGAADSTIMAIAGHVSRKMLERYSHVRMEAKRAAMETLSEHENSQPRPNGSDRCGKTSLEFWMLRVRCPTRNEAPNMTGYVDCAD